MISSSQLALDKVQFPPPTFHICIQCSTFRILTIDPQHVQGQHNLCVVYVERGLLLEVKREKCDTDSELTNIFCSRGKNVSRKLWPSHQRKNIYRTT